MIDGINLTLAVITLLAVLGVAAKLQEAVNTLNEYIGKQKERDAEVVRTSIDGASTATRKILKQERERERNLSVQ